ncbi:hypothetical protein [Aquimarina intermedia]|uniref:Addiction module component n=1 Tax=Aquimarina intermedia TaxID=350814 RepID=A0A5S5C9V2_9FLAO|nr:hypothetical protein [Aquimarina intermedia]TYP76175.1 hypothetical protein BD809_102392 [Aquimarina intermedia]
MNISELQNDIIKRVLSLQDEQTLTMLKKILSNSAGETPYTLSDFENQLVSDSVSAYKAGNVVDNDQVFKDNDAWLEK